MNVAVIGASDKPDRFSYQAVQLLQEKGHRVFPVHQRIKQIGALSVFPSIADIVDPIETVTLYVAADISTKLAHDILSKKPKRIIFNPGAENPELEHQARSQGVVTANDCTLVMLRSGTF